MRETEEPEVPRIEEAEEESPSFTPDALEEFKARNFVRRNRQRVSAEEFLPRRPPRMQKGQEFIHPTTGDRWRVTDVGTRTFLAINLSDTKVVADPSWANGPPYAIVESVWDEVDYGLLRDVPGIEWDE